MSGEPPSAAQPAQVPIGKHMIVVEDDLVIVHLSGDFVLSDMQEFYALAQRMSQQHPIYCIGDMTHAGSISPDARRYAVENGAGLRIVCCALFGISATMRVLLIMLTRAAKLVRRTANEAALEFVKTEAAARECIAALRVQKAAAPVSSE